MEIEKEMKKNFQSYLLILGTIYTCNRSQEWARSMLVERFEDKKSKIIFIGEENECEKFIQTHTILKENIESQSYNQGIILPGFQDAHVHPFVFKESIIFKKF